MTLTGLSERPISAVPRALWLALLLAFGAQLLWQATQPKPVASAAALAPPAPLAALRITSLGEPVVLAQLMTLYLQAFDNQPGISIPFKDLDYQRVTQWLSTILTLDPVGQYPLLMASQVYAEVPDPVRVRLMFDFVHEQFLQDPNRRWRWLAQASIMAKHRLNDNALALSYADELARLAPAAPDWARQMHIFILEDLGEAESAKIMLGGLIESGQITDEHEMHFLLERLEAMKNGEKPSPATRN